MIKKFDYTIDGKQFTGLKRFYNQGFNSNLTINLIIFDTLNPYKLRPKRLAIHGTKYCTLTLDLTFSDEFDWISKGQLLFISNTKINFPNEDDIDFGELNVIFNKCEIDDKNRNKVKGNILLFDNESYYSFYNQTDQITAFNGDNIQITQSSIYVLIQLI